MAFQLSDFISLKPGGSQAVQTPGSVQPEQQAPPADTSQLQAGSTFSGRIVGFDGKDIQILLDSQQMLNARLDSQLGVNLGQLLSFEVKGNSGGQIALRPLYANLDNQSAVLKAIDEAFIPKNELSAQLVRALMQEGMPIDRNTLQGMYKTLFGNQSLDPLTLVQMTKLGLPATENNVEQFKAYQNLNHQLVQTADTVSADIAGLMRELAQGGNTGELTAFHNKLLDIFLPAGGGETAEGALKDAGVLTPDGQPMAGTMELEEGSVIAKQQTNGETVQEQPAGAAQGQETAQEAAAGAGKGAAATEGAPISDTAAEGAAADTASAAAAGSRGAAAEGAQLMSFMSPADREQLAMKLQQAGAPPELAEAVSKGTAKSHEVLAHVKQLIEAGQLPEKQAAELLTGKQYQSLMKNQLQENWMLRPEQVAQKEKVEQLYERLGSQSEKITQLLTAMGKTDSALMNSASNVRNNVDFMNQMNQMFTYVQLPLKLAQDKAHGDLYVYTNKKNLAKKDGNVTALLHLDMDHLGGMDVYVTMQAQKVSTRFTLEKEEMLDFLEANMHLLTERLTKRGYDVKTEVTMGDKKEESVVNDMLKSGGKTVTGMSQRAFDMRA